MIRRCNQCSGKPHTQDDLHGKGMRVINVHELALKRHERCKVCGSETIISLQPKAAQKELVA